MEEAARRFARRILALHFLALLALVALVIVASGEIYRRTRQQAEAQAMEQQMLLARQAASGVEGFYESILANLDLMGRNDAESAASGSADPRPPGPGERLLGNRAPMALAPLLWRQLEGRVSNVIAVVRPGYKVVGSFPADKQAEAQKIVEESREWLKTVKGEMVSGVKPTARGLSHLVCLSNATQVEGKLILAAVVPVAEVDERYLRQINAERGVRVTLIDDKGLVLAASDSKSVGRPYPRALEDAKIAALLADGAAPGNVVVRDQQSIDGTLVQPRVVSVHRVNVAGRNWRVMISGDLAAVDAMVGQLFGRALVWAVVVVAGVAALLASTAFQMIRSRVRLERARSELLARELEQARKIQLAWLPTSTHAGPGVSVAAVNRPASHISGDFYDWFELPGGRSVVSIGDVSGHGMSAAFLMATTQLLIRNTMLRLADPGTCLEEVNHQLCAQVFNGQFVTVAVALLDPFAHTIAVAVAGHFPPLVTDPAGSLAALPMDSQLVLGVEADTSYPTERFPLPAGSRVLLYTDGVADAQNSRGERYTAARIRAAGARAPGDAQAMVDAVLQDVARFQGPGDPGDDLTLVAVAVQPTDSKKPADAGAS